MPWLLQLIPLVGLLVGAPVLMADWREDLLREYGFALDKASLENVSQQGISNDKDLYEDLEEPYKALASDQFAEREEAQRRLVKVGKKVLGFLKAKEPIDDPEVRFRVTEIRKVVRPGVENRVGPIVQQAAISLLEDADDPQTGGRFFEWFGVDQNDCRDGYRALVHDGNQGQRPVVNGGRLKIPGQHGGKEDRRLILRAKDWPGTK